MSTEKMMVVEAQDDQEVMGCHNQDHAQLVIKGKRTKRQRPHSPLTLAMVSSSCSAVESGGEIGERFSSDNINYNSGGGGGGGLDHGHHDGGMQGAGSPSSSVDFATSSEEEEDMANCLILLAQGHSNCKQKACAEAEVHVQANNKGGAGAGGAAGLCVYECKTCNRCFPSFQALGGHRASHKKPKPNSNNNGEKKANSVIMEEEDHHHYTNINMSTTLSLQMATNRTALYANATSNNVVKANKVHECSICGAEFSSGQALGGHMRRHRALATTTAPPTTALSMATTSSTLHQSPEPKKPRNNDLLRLDLNLPAPEEESKFGFSSKEQVIIFSASSLVDCHY